MHSLLEQIQNLYVLQGLTDREISKELGIKKWKVTKIRKDYAITRKKSRTKEEFINLYFVQKMTISEIADLWGVGATTVTRWKRSWKISSKPKTDSWVGRRFGNLVVLEETPGKKGQPIQSRCRCDCGGEVSVRRHNLQRTRSCGCLRRPDVIGKKYGRLMILERVEGPRGSKYKCVCDCGGTSEVYLGAIQSGSTKSCGCLRSPTISPGTKFGRLTVLQKVKNSDSPGWSYRCSCSCGAETIVLPNSLHRSSTQSCGCLARDRASLPEGEAAFRSVLRTYRKNAAKRDLTFQLSNEEFRILAAQPCSYCGQEAIRVRKGRNGGFKYSGVDRVDNSIGYLKENCVSCCFMCNRAKGTQSLEDFLSWVYRLGFEPNRIFAWESVQQRDYSINSYPRIKSSASERGLQMDLTYAEVGILSSSPCYYCGIEPSKIRIGIDRRDSMKGYIRENSVPCCSTCNRAKNTLSVEEFHAWALRVQNFKDPSTPTPPHIE